MKITLFEIPDDEQDFFSEELSSHDLIFSKEPLSAKTVIGNDSEIISVFVSSEVNADVLKQFPNLRAVVTRSTGFDHIDTSYCHDMGITVCHVPHYGENTVAEHTFALLLALSRNIHSSYIRALKDDFEAGDLVGFELAGKTLGVVGTGSIGAQVIRIAHGFSMKVLAHSRTKEHDLINDYSVEYTDTLAELMRRSDIVSLHVPLTESTYHMINEDVIDHMRDGAVIINTSRGELIDTDALYKALRSGKLGGAGLDVIEGEEHIQEDIELLYEHKNPDIIRQIYRDREIFKMENVVFTPHSGFNSKEAKRRLLKESAANIKAFIEGNPKNTIS